RGAQQRRRLVEQNSYLSRPDANVPAPSERQYVVDQIASALSRPLDLVDMLGRLASGRHLRLRHLRIAENGADDVIEIVRDAARQRTDHLHASGPLQPRRKPRPIAFEELAINGV